MNVILLINDTHRADHIGAYGNKWIHTPNLDRLAQGSAVFTRAYAEGCPTLQARRALWTGKRTFPFTDHKVLPGDRLNLQFGWRNLHDDDRCLSEILKDAGYVTGYITDCPQVFKPGMNFHRGFATWEYIRGQGGDYFRTGYHFKDVPRQRCHGYEERARQVGHGRKQQAHNLDRNWEEEYCVARVFRAAARWLEDNGDVDGFFLVVDNFDPHEPWDPPAYYEGLHSRRDLLKLPYELELTGPRRRTLTLDELVSIRARYAGEVALYDRWLGHFLETARLLGLYDNTIICFISDHGTHIGDHGKIAKGPPGMYDGAVRVPMMIRHPKGAGARRRIGGLVYNMDLVPTILRAVGVKSPVKMHGVDLWPLIRGKKRKLRKCLTSGYREWIWYRDEAWTYHGTIMPGVGDKLFDARNDPEENDDLAAKHPDVVAQIREAIVEEAGPLRTETDYMWPEPGFHDKYPTVF